MKHVLLIGCGNIGFRHLQALGSMARADKVALHVVEPDTAQHDRIRTQMAATPMGGGDLATALPEGGAYDLAVIATNSNIRRKVFDDMLARARVSAVIFEKVLFQTRGDLDAVGAALTARGIAGYVNCGRRGFPGYQGLAHDRAGDRPLTMTVDGAGWAMASNGIHFFDIAAFLNASPLVSVDASGLSPGITESKRGGYKEIFGTLTGRLANGAAVSLTCAREDTPRIAISLEGTGLAAQIDEASHAVTLTCDGQDEVQVFETRHVSQMPALYEGLLFGGGTALTPYEESADHHRLMLDALRPHLGLSNDADDPCPIS